jgi:hypothetical protein
MQKKFLIVLVTAMLIFQPVSALAPLNVREALVIGNSNYPNAPLLNPVNDAEAMGRSLKELGFKVAILKNASKQEIETEVKNLARRIKDTQGLSFVYFAGHGVQVDYENFILPVDSNIRTQADIAAQSVSVNQMVEEINRQGGRLNIMVLDSCRDNPFAAKEAFQGLAPSDAPKRSLIAYATEPGNVALDGVENSKNGLYTEHLLKQMNNVSAPVDSLFKRVRYSVRRASLGRQVPSYSNGVFEDITLDGQDFFANLSFDEKKKRFNTEKQNWDQIKTSKNPEVFYQFISDYPYSSLSELAQGTLERITRQTISAQAFQGEATQNPAETRFREGDTYTMKISLDSGQSFVLKSSVYEVTEETAKYTNVFGAGATGMMTIAGAVISDGQNTFDPPYVLVPGADYQVGKRWSGRTIRTDAKGLKAWMDYSGRVISREKITVQAGTFLAYKTEIDFQIEGGKKLKATLWVQPEWGLAIKTNYQFLDPNGRVRSGIREMLDRSRS